MKSAIAKGNVLSAVTKTPVATKAILVPQRSTINVYGNTGRAFLLSPIPSASARAALDSRYILLLNGHIESGSHMTEGDRKAIADLAKMVADLSTSIGNTQIDFSNLFEIVNQGQPNEYILAKLSFHSKNDVVAFSNGADGGTVPSIPIATYTTAGVVKVDPTTMTVDANGMIAVKGDLFNLSNYYDKSASDGRYLLKTEKPDLTGYATKIYVDDQISTHTHTLYVKYQTPETPAPQTIYGDIRVIGKIYSSDDIVAFSDGTGGGTAPSIPLATYSTVGVVKVDPSTMTVDANGMIAVKGDLFNLSNYYDKSASDGRFAAVSHTHTKSQIIDFPTSLPASDVYDWAKAATKPSYTFSELDGKPTTLGGYGITDAIKNTGGTIAGDLTITGNLYLQQDGKYIVTEKVYSENDFITLRYNNPSLLAAGAYAGFEAKKVFADGTDGYLVFGNDGMARVGKLTSLQMLATREDSPVDGSIQYYSAINKRLTSGVQAADLWHKGNSNLPTADWTAKRLLAILKDPNKNTANIIGNWTNSGYYGFGQVGENTVGLKGCGADGVFNANANFLVSGSLTANQGLSVIGSAKLDFNTKHYLRSGHANYNGGIYYDTYGDEALLFGFKNSSTRIKFKTGLDFEALAANSVTGMKNADLEIGNGFILTPATKLRGPDGNVKWTAQVSATGNYLEFYNASGVLEMRLSQAGKIQVRDDVEAFSNFS